MRESKIEEYLVKQTLAHGGIALKLVMMGKRNFPDRTVLLPFGYVIFVELKAPKKDLRKTQEWFARKVMKPLGFRTCRIRTLDEVDNLFIEYKAYVKSIKKVDS